jgi:intergrase/recombinase
MQNDQRNKRTGGRPKGSKSKNLLKPHNQIAKCIKEESITGLLWALIQLAQHEIKHEGRVTTFSGADLSKFVALLHQREVSNKLSSPDQLDTSAVQAWLTSTAE